MQQASAVYGLIHLPLAVVISDGLGPLVEDNVESTSGSYTADS